MVAGLDLSTMTVRTLDGPVPARGGGCGHAGPAREQGKVLVRTWSFESLGVSFKSRTIHSAALARPRSVRCRVVEPDVVPFPTDQQTDYRVKCRKLGGLKTGRESAT